MFTDIQVPNFSCPTGVDIVFRGIEASIGRVQRFTFFEHVPRVDLSSRFSVMRRCDVLIGVALVLGGCICSTPSPGFYFPAEVGESTRLNLAGSLVDFVPLTLPDGGVEAVVVTFMGDGLVVVDADGGSTLVTHVSSRPLELSLQRQGDTVRAVVTVFNRPYSELVFWDGSTLHSLSKSGAGPFHGELSSTPDGVSFLVASEQGLDGCSDRPVVAICKGARACSTRCLPVTRGETTASRTGGVVVARSSAGLDTFLVESAAFDGGGEPLEPSHHLDWDGGRAPELVAVAPDGQAAMGYFGGAPAQIAFWNPRSVTQFVLQPFADLCVVFSAQATPTHVLVRCIEEVDGVPVQKLVRYAWNGVRESAQVLGRPDERIFLAPHRGQLLQATPVDGGVSITRLY